MLYNNTYISVHISIYIEQHNNIRKTRDKRGTILQWVDDTPKTDSGVPPTDIPASTDIPPVNPQPTDTTQTQESSNETQQPASDGAKSDAIKKEGPTKEHLQTFDELAGEDERHLVPGEKLRDVLLSRYKLSQSNVDAIIMNMEMTEDGIEEVSHLIEGLSYPTYRRKYDN